MRQTKYLPSGRYDVLFAGASGVGAVSFFGVHVVTGACYNQIFPAYCHVAEY